MKRIQDFIFEWKIDDIYLLVRDYNQLLDIEYKFPRNCDIVKEIDKILKTE